MKAYNKIIVLTWYVKTSDDQFFRKVKLCSSFSYAYFFIKAFQKQ